MKTELVALEVSEKNYPKIYCAGGLDAFYEKAKAEVDGEVPDLSTGKGRDRIATLAADVSRSKVAVEKPGRAYNKFLKAQPKLIDKELREFCDKMDKLRDDTRAPLTAWEVIDNAGKQQVIDVAAYLIKFDDDLEEGHRDNELIDLRAAQAKADRLAEIKSAADKAAADAKAKAEVEAAERIAQAEHEKIVAEQREIAAKQAAIDAENKAAQDAINAAAREAKAKQDAIDAQERARYEAEQAEQRRISAEQQAIRDAETAAENARKCEVRKQEVAAHQAKVDQAAREADLDNKMDKNSAAEDAIMALGFNEEGAKSIIKAIAKGLIPAVTIRY